MAPLNESGRTSSAFALGLLCALVLAAVAHPVQAGRLSAGTKGGGASATEQGVRSCDGDCRGDGAVTIDELIAIVNIALRSVNLTACPAGDANRDGTITINEIIQAVDRALDGCAADIEEATVAALQAAMEAARANALDLVEHYLERIELLDRSGPTLRAVIEINPDARSIAQALDVERHDHGARGPLHGIPVLLKDNIDTGDQMLTTAGSLALIGAPATRDATVAERLRDAGAVLLGKTNLSEWSGARSFRASNGWSARGGQTLNPYALDHSPCGSSSGSAVAVAANLPSHKWIDLRTTVDGGGLITSSGGIFVVRSEGRLDLENLAIAEGGSGIDNGGAVTVTNCNFVGRHTGDYGGGGITNRGTLTVIHSTFVGNSTTGYGGGIRNDRDGATLTVIDSTLLRQHRPRQRRRHRQWRHADGD